MIFSTLEFAIFMTAVFLIYWGIPQRFRYIVLLAANLYFYAFYDVKYLLVLFVTTVISYFIAAAIEKESGNDGKKKLIFTAGLVSVLALLFVFK